MTNWAMSREQMSADELWRLQSNLQLNPGYQREGRLWSRERQQLFADSVVNGFDVPPIYLHRLSPPQIEDGSLRTYAVIDGQQRLRALWNFLDGLLTLPVDARLLSEGSGDNDVAAPGGLGNMGIADLKAHRPDLYAAILNYKFAVTVVSTDDVSLIEEMFFRLNEGVPLTPAEKRHRGELLRRQLEDMLVTRGALEIYRPRNRRRSHEDLLLRLLYLESEYELGSEFPDLKKRALDDFAASFGNAVLGVPDPPDEAQRKADELGRLASRVLGVLAAMNRVFEVEDRRLTGSSWFLTYYLLFRHLMENGDPLPTLSDIERFWDEIENLNGAEEDRMSRDQLEGIEAAGALPATTTGSYFAARVDLLLRYHRGQVDLVTPAPAEEVEKNDGDDSGRGV